MNKKLQPTTSARLVSPLLAGLLLLPTAAAAQTTGADQLGVLQVTATRTPASTSSLVVDTDSASFDRWRDRGFQSVSEGLGMMSGITLTSNGGPAATGSLFIRGATAGQTLTLVDGFRVSSASLGQPTYEALPLLLADRVEVLRGPGSAYYGADALGGVVQLLTPTEVTGYRGLGEIAIGSEATRRVIGGISGGNEAVSFSLRLSRDQSDGYNVTRPGFFAFNDDVDGYERDGVLASMSAELSGRTGMRLVYLRTDLDADFDDGAFDNARTLNETQLTGLTVEHELSDQTMLEFRLGQTRDRSESISSFPGTFETVQDQVYLAVRRALTDTIELSLNAERLEQDVDTTAYAPNVAPTRTTNSFGLALSGRDGPHLLQLSVRRDNNSQYNNQTNGTLSYGYMVAPGLRAGGSYASGFRAPGFNDLYFPGYGRPAIQPEKSRNAELGLYLDQRTPGGGSAWFGKAVVYNNAVRELIVYAPVCPDPDPQFAFGCADNVNRARLRGVSLELGRRHGGLNWRVSADFQDPVDRTTGTLLARRSKRQLRASVDYSVGAWLVGADMRAESFRFDDAANTTRLGGYGLLNLNVRRKLGKGWTGFLSVSNALDKDYTTAGGYQSQGRVAMLGVRYRSPRTR